MVSRCDPQGVQPACINGTTDKNYTRWLVMSIRTNHKCMSMPCRDVPEGNPQRAKSTTHNTPRRTAKAYATLPTGVMDHPTLKGTLRTWEVDVWCMA
jgi:hypothetical protein